MLNATQQLCRKALYSSYQQVNIGFLGFGYILMFIEQYNYCKPVCFQQEKGNE